MKSISKAIRFILLTLAVLVVVVITLLPFVVRWQAIAWLEKQGLEASIGYVDIRPILGSVQINDIDIHSAIGERLVVGELELNIDWAPLLDHWLQIQSVRLENTSVDLAMGPDILRVGGIVIPSGNSEPAPDGEQTEAAISRITVEQVEVENLVFCYLRVDGQDQPVANQCVSVEQLSPRGELVVAFGEERSLGLPGLDISGVGWFDRLQPLELASIDAIRLSGVASPDLATWQLEQLKITELGILPASDRALVLDTLTLGGLSAGQGISMKSLSLGTLQLHLQLDEQSGLTFAPALMARLAALSPPAAETAVSPDDDPGPSPVIQLDSLALDAIEVAADRPLLRFAGLNLSALTLQGAEVSLRKAGVSDLQVLSGNDDVLSLDHFALAGLVVKGDVAVDSLSLGNTSILLQPGDNGALTFAPALMAQLNPSGSGDRKPGVDTGAEASPAMGISLGNLQTGNISVAADRELVAIKTLALQQFNQKGEAIGLGGLSIEALQLLAPLGKVKGVGHYVEVPELSLNGLTVDSASVGLERLVISDPELYLHRGKDGRLVMVEELTALAGTSAEQTTDENGPASPLRVKIGEVHIGDNGQLRVLDESVSPPLEQQFSKLAFTIQHLDASRPAENASVDFHLGVNRFGYFKLSGDMTPFGDTLNSSIEGELSGLDVRDLSGYSGKYIGYHLDQGTVDADIRVKVRQDEIDATIDTRFNKLEVSAIPETDLPEGAEQLGVPLEFALALLRDNDGMIGLKLPVSGNIHSPNFSLNHIIGKVLFKVIGETVINYYLPFGLLAKSMVSNGLANLAFQSVIFAPGAAELDVPARENLGKLTEMLLNRQQLHLVFCAPSTLQDWQAAYAPEQLDQPEGNGKKSEDVQRQGEATGEASSESVVPEITDEQQASLVLLADRRTEAAKAFLVDAGVKPGQVIPCTGEFQVGKDSAPEMTISIGQ
ncbi:MAG: DUF748 domain-containing protein [Porticoccaceae bacterium]